MSRDHLVRYSRLYGEADIIHGKAKRLEQELAAGVYDRFTAAEVKLMEDEVVALRNLGDIISKQAEMERNAWMRMEMEGK